MTYRALALDLDGTLLGLDDKVSARNRAAVEAAVAAGWHVILATARWYQLAERTAHDLGLDDPVIACSGAEVRRLRDGTDLLDVRIPADFAAALYEVCDQHTEGMAFVYEDREVVTNGPLSPSLEAMPEVRRVASLSAEAERDPRCILLFGDELNAGVLEGLGPSWSDEVRFLTSVSVQGHVMLTLTGAKADKGLALEIACRDLGIALTDVVAMGDSETDIEMFKVAGASVAMGQAHDPVKAAATWVTSHHGEDGVGIAIEALLAGRSPGD